MLSDQELMHLHVEALFTHDPNQRLRAINEPDGAPAPRFFLGRTTAGHIRRFRSDIPEPLVQQLAALCADEPLTSDLRAPPRHCEAYQRLLQTHGAIQHRWMGPAYQFPAALNQPPHVVRITGENAELLEHVRKVLT